MFPRNGFTLSEILIVLTAWSILLVCIIPLHVSTFRSVETSAVMDQLKDDIYLAQQLTVQDHPYYWLSFRLSSNDYVLYDAQDSETIFIRKFPKNWRFELMTLENPIRFNSRGIIAKPGTMKLYSPTDTYKLVFPFGSSRMNIEQQ
ncbi:competence type IV pilus minor pilin ComGD [Halobacillus sp. BBL2006]|uniref:competence type IV pilus minor pilin ComGD n=1 Tax=Halobacillus sp. BBL2006 TaxID=1543706 RepID=UPI0005439C36|nr:competence type IV pilus minor pilin ComGD [Halobacillus sp. BBL2006]KHE70701.1 competence protein ComG [Halobacillus sp. BBL2006]